MWYFDSSILAESGQNIGRVVHYQPTKTLLDISSQEAVLSEHEDIDIRGEVSSLEF